MIPADRARLEEVLRLAEECIRADSDPNMECAALDYIDEARTILNYPATPPEQRTLTITRLPRSWDENTTTETIIKTDHAEFWDEPAHKRLERIWDQRNRAERTRRRRILLGTLTVPAAILLALALSADTPPTPGPSHQGNPVSSLTGQPDPIPGTFPTTRIPYQPATGPGTPGNGLGVLP